jgi:hypothetical protein
MSVLYGLWIHWFRDPGATIPNGSIIIGRTSLVGVGCLRSDSIVPLILCMVFCAMAVALTLYYRSFEIVSTLLKMSNILGRPCMRVMTYNILAFFCIKALR